MTIAPLPDWCNFLKIFNKASIDRESLLKPWLRDGETGGWLSRSAWSLALIALWKSREIKESRPLVIWVPDFFCNEPLNLLRLSGAKLFFYPVTELFEPNYTLCRTQTAGNPPDIFLLIHYFGKPATGGTAKEFCKINQCWLVEDAAHVLKPISGIGEYGDFVFYSLHKLLPIFDGAVLVVRKKGPSCFNETYINELGNNNSWVRELTQMFKDKIAIHQSSILSVKWLFKRFLQKIGINRVVIQSFKQAPMQTHQLGIIDPQMTTLSSRLLKAAIPKLAITSACRKRHQKIWKQIFDNNDSVKADEVFENEAPDINKWVPYNAVIKSSGDMDEHFYLFQKKKTYATTWPDLAPEVMADQGSHSTAIFLRHSRLYFPVHQSIKGGDFRRILKGINRLLTYSHESISLVQGITRDNWNEFLKKIGQSNLLQSWAYGEAKLKTEGWDVKRLVFQRAEVPLAIVQVLEKRIAGLIRVRRVNRGPLFFPDTSASDKMEVFGKLIRFGNVFQGKILTIAPELALTGANLVAVISNKIHNFNPRGWTSVWIDLRPEMEKLRSNLNGKWRNKLGIAEKNNLKVEIGSGPDLVQWMIKRYKENMHLKDFEGIRLPVLEELYRNSMPDCPLIICRANFNGEYIGGLCIACHGTAATYLVGWTGPEGRNLKANHILLWTAIENLRKNGIDWLDLGGLDEEATPGITEFKSGMGGTIYELVGEGWKL